MKRSLITVAFQQALSESPVTQSLVVSEPVEEFFIRNAKYNDRITQLQLVCVLQVKKTTYNSLRLLNPTDEGYLYLLKGDYSACTARTDEEDDDDDGRRS